MCVVLYKYRQSTVHKSVPIPLGSSRYGRINSQDSSGGLCIRRGQGQWGWEKHPVTKLTVFLGV